jgi:hypothetical protein
LLDKQIDMEVIKNNYIEVIVFLNLFKTVFSQHKIKKPKTKAKPKPRLK